MIKNLKYIIILITLLGFSLDSFSQSNALNAVDPEDIGHRADSYEEEDVLEYGFIDDKDILFSKMVWETIDVNQKVNFPYLYPTEFLDVGQERRPLLYFIKEAIEGDYLKPNQIYTDANFNNTKTKLDLENIWRDKKPLLEGANSLQDPQQFISDALEDGRKFEDESPIFPYTYSDKMTDSLQFTEDDFKAFYGSIYYNGMKGQDYLDPSGNALSDEKKDLYPILVQTIVKKLWIADTHFTWVNLGYDDLTEWRIKGLWYFDKRQSHLKYRLIGIAPVAKPLNLTEEEDSGSNNGGNSSDVDICYDDFGDEIPCDGSEGEVADRELANTGSENSQTDIAVAQTNLPRELFWLYYPHVRDILSKKRSTPAIEDGKRSREPVVFSEKNSSVRKTFDELLNSRRFNAVIYKEENVYQDRNLVKAYPKNSFMKLLEAESIKDKIRNLEHNMWSW